VYILHAVMTHKLRLSLILVLSTIAARPTSGADTVDPTRANAPLPGGIWVETLDLTKITKRGRWATHAAKSTGGNPMRIAGTLYPHGVGMHAPGGLLIALNGAATRFVARVGVDDEPATEYGTGSIVFEIWVDGKLAKTTGVLRKGQSEAMDVDLRGAKTVELLTMDGDDGSNGDHADWAGAQLILVPHAAKTPQSFLPEPDPAPIIQPSDESVIRLNGPRAVGASPGRPFVYRLPVSGPRPLKFSAKGLPKGLILDATTGILRGRMLRAGVHDVKIVISGPSGTKTETLKLVAGLDKLALTPPMGWSSWNAFGNKIDAAMIRNTANALVETGLANFGYQYVNIDEGWEDGRDETGRIRVAAKMGDLKTLANHIHQLGLRMGLYSSPGPKTCGGFTGSLGYEKEDAQSLVDWEVDYFKHDWCSYEKIVPDESDPMALKRPYVIMGQALQSVPRDVVYALCQYGLGRVWEWGGSVGGNLWRTTGDLVDTWGSMWGIGFAHHTWSPHAAPGGWNDPDMLVLGWTGGWEGGPARPTRLSKNEQIVHFTQWSMLAAPLIMGMDLSKLDAFTRTLLTHEEVIAVDQDPLGKAATRRARIGRGEIWARPLADGTMAVALYNLGWSRTRVQADWSDLGLSGPQSIRDLWQRKDLGIHNGSIAADVPQHSAVLLKIGNSKL
jgi:alpha-galactosidase